MTGRIWGSRPRVLLALFLLGLMLYTPGVWSGLPYASAADRIRPWNPDELAPLGPVAELYSVVSHSPNFNPQYPLFHYVVQASVVGPYVALLWLTGELREPAVEYPYGLSDPVAALARMTLLARLVNLLMGAAVAAIACRTGEILWGRRSGVIAGVLVVLSYPTFYYARVSTTDMGALFWTSLGLAVFAVCIRHGLNRRRAVWLGAFAALSTATKDPGYGAFLLVGLFVAAEHWRRRGGIGARRVRSDLSAGLLTALGVYAVASGLALHPQRFIGHIEFILGLVQGVSVDPARPRVEAVVLGYADLFRITCLIIADSLGRPLAIVAPLGLVLYLRRAPKTLALALPAVGVFLFVIAPTGFVVFRYVMTMAYVSALFAATALAAAWSSPRRGWRWVAGAWLVVGCGVALVRGADLTYQMVNDSRYEVAEWFRENARPGDRVGFYGGWDNFPPLDSSIVTMPMPGQWAYLAGPPPAEDVEPEFIMIFAFKPGERPGAWTLPDDTFRRLMDGSWNYELVLSSQTPSLLSERLIPVNPLVRVFARKDRLEGSVAEG